MGEVAQADLTVRQQGLPVLLVDLMGDVDLLSSLFGGR
jgi:hypothetical protein